MSILFDKVYFRDLLLRDKGFLNSLYKNESLSNREQIKGADDIHLNTVIQILYLIANNEIPVYEDDILQIKNARQFKLILKHFKSHKEFFKLLIGPRESKVKILSSLGGVYCHLFVSIFEEK